MDVRGITPILSASSIEAAGGDAGFAAIRRGAAALFPGVQRG